MKLRNRELPTQINPRDLGVHRDQPLRDVPYVPTPGNVVQSMLKLGGVHDRDIVYDLGCGDGRIVIEAARRGARGVGVDIDLQRIRECLDNATRAGVRDRVKFIRGSFFDVDLGDATVVMLYLLPGINVKLRPKLLWELKPGTRIVSNYFEIGDWQPDVKWNVHFRTLYLWFVPAWIGGRWHCTLNLPNRREHMLLDLHHRYQVAWGTAKIGGSVVPLRDVRLKGHQLCFTLSHPRRSPPLLRFLAHVRRNTIRGACTGYAIDPAIPWGGTRIQ
jgi:SAM-dependent methyltransferase